MSSKCTRTLDGRNHCPSYFGDSFFYQRRYPSDLLLASLLYHFTVAVRYFLFRSAVSTISDTNIDHSAMDNHAVSTSYCNFETLFEFIYPTLYSCSHVYLRIDCVQPPLSQQYSGPHPVISRKDKTFIMTFNDKNQTVSVDRMKPAFFLPDNTTVCAEYKEKTPSITHDLSVTKDSFQVYFRLLQELKTPNCLTSRTCSQIHYHLLRRLSHGLADMCIFIVIY
ncbi:integrase catalytic domain-containing protein [Caerostris extrusa]|uniref:Integrase catalytic domain-containing protein n=1 Tax=Caerostris extrusa TaxID=172846 RepID=A0AAV4P2V7_CAEEX|nr:integrase catalytic domain-containing protein [Caerostris extrusa]